MKFKKVKSEDLTNGLVQVAGAGVGFMLPNGIANAVLKVTDEASISDDQRMKKMYINAGAVALGLYVALATDGDDVTAQGIKSLGLGIAGGGFKGVAQQIQLLQLERF
jgi:hypothetical protein